MQPRRGRHQIYLPLYSMREDRGSVALLRGTAAILYAAASVVSEILSTDPAQRVTFVLGRNGTIPAVAPLLTQNFVPRDAKRNAAFHSSAPNRGTPSCSLMQTAWWDHARATTC